MTPFRYAVRFPNRRTHYVEVEATFPTEGRDRIEIFLAVWTPGSYLVREYSRNLEDLRAAGEQGNDLPVTKTRKNRWMVETLGCRQVTFRYRVYCREMSVRTNWVEDGFAFLNGAPTFVSVVGETHRPHEVTIELPPEWSTSFTALPTPCDYDTLVDSPIVAGNPSSYSFSVDGVEHVLVNEGEGGVWDADRSIADLTRMVRQCSAMWGGLPFRRYLFLNLITESRGGLEHRDSCVLMTNRWATRTPAAYLEWLRLAAHEYFHVWNAKRLRPVELGPFDYENENYTRSLWITEGFTEYYGDLVVARAGLMTPEQYIGTCLSALVQSLESTPGRHVQSAAASSYDAWIKLYRPNENSGNTAISYYTKGALIAWLLDARIRRSSSGLHCLDDVMRLAMNRFSGPSGFTPEQFIATAEEATGVALREYALVMAETTRELDYTEALDWFGLLWTPEKAPAWKPYLGVETREQEGRLVVTAVPRGTPAFQAGINVDDELIALDGFRFRPAALGSRLEQYRPGDRVSLLIARREHLLEISVCLAAEPAKMQLALNPLATSDQKRNLLAWLGSDTVC